MLKKIFRKNGIIFINNCKEKNIKLIYFIINHYNINKDINHLKKNYYQSIGYQYKDDF